jgi:hypothetical protein
MANGFGKRNAEQGEGKAMEGKTTTRKMRGKEER